MDRIFFATILCNKEKVLSLYESNGSPITITHVIKLWKKLCQSVVVDMWKGQTSHVFLEVKFGRGVRNMMRIKSLLELLFIIY